jgi:hypothetical protein
MDVGKILDTLYSILEKKQLIVSKKNKIEILVAVLNIAAHYRHYYSDILHQSNSLLFYCENPENYDNYSDILEDLKEICNFIPNSIYIPQISTNKTDRYFYIHTTAYIIEHTKKIAERNHRELVLNVIGNNPLEYQFFTIVKNTYFLTVNSVLERKILTITKIWENLLKNDVRFSNPIYDYELRLLLIPYMVIYKKIKVKIQFIGLQHVRSTEKVDQLFRFIEDSGKSITLWDNYGLNCVPNEINSFLSIMNSIFYHSNVKIKPFIVNFVNSWSKKLTDSKIYSLNDYINTFDINNLQISWLLEDKGV